MYCFTQLGVKPPAEPNLFKWHLDDISVLVGSDLLVFKSPDDQAPKNLASVYLMDLENDITKLRSLDVWLDNVLTNIPEVCVTSLDIIIMT